MHEQHIKKQLTQPASCSWAPERIQELPIHTFSLLMGLALWMQVALNIAKYHYCQWLNLENSHSMGIKMGMQELNYLTNLDMTFSPLLSYISGIFGNEQSERKKEGKVGHAVLQLWTEEQETSGCTETGQKNTAKWVKLTYFGWVCIFKTFFDSVLKVIFASFAFWSAEI